MGKGITLNYSLPSPCQDCSDRDVGCHAKCSRYSEYKAKANDASKKIFEQRLEYRNRFDKHLQKYCENKKNK